MKIHNSHRYCENVETSSQDTLFIGQLAVILGWRMAVFRVMLI